MKTVLLTNIGYKKLEVIKLIRMYSGYGLLEAKNACEAIVPGSPLGIIGVPDELADTVISALSAVGASAAVSESVSPVRTSGSFTIVSVDGVNKLEDMAPSLKEEPVSVPSSTVPAGTSSGLMSTRHVLLLEVGEKKLQVIKLIRGYTGFGLLEAKNACESIEAGNAFRINCVPSSVVDKMIDEFAKLGGKAVRETSSNVYTVVYQGYYVDPEGNRFASPVTADTSKLGESAVAQKETASSVTETGGAELRDFLGVLSNLAVQKEEEDNLPQTSGNVMLTSTGSDKFGEISLIRKYTGCGLRDAKQAWEEVRGGKPFRINKVPEDKRKEIIDSFALTSARVVEETLSNTRRSVNQAFYREDKPEAESESKPQILQTPVKPAPEVISESTPLPPVPQLEPEEEKPVRMATSGGNLLLLEVGFKKLQIVKLLREYAGLDLKDAKEACESTGDGRVFRLNRVPAEKIYEMINLFEQNGARMIRETTSSVFTVTSQASYVGGKVTAPSVEAISIPAPAPVTGTDKPNVSGSATAVIGKRVSREAERVYFDCLMALEMIKKKCEDTIRVIAEVNERGAKRDSKELYKREYLIDMPHVADKKAWLHLRYDGKAFYVAGIGYGKDDHGVYVAESLKDNGNWEWLDVDEHWKYLSGQFAWRHATVPFTEFGDDIQYRRQAYSRYVQLLSEFKSNAETELNGGQRTEEPTVSRSEAEDVLGKVKILLKKAYGVDVIPAPSRDNVYAAYHLYDAVKNSDESVESALKRFIPTGAALVLGDRIDAEQDVIIRRATEIAMNAEENERIRSGLQRLAEEEEDNRISGVYRGILECCADLCVLITGTEFIKTV